MPSKDEQYYHAHMKHNVVSRRGLLRGLFGGMKKAHQEVARPSVKRTIPRPPSAIEEGLFQSLCDGCGKCEQACPEYVIQIENGLAEVNLDYGHCTLCGECTKACKTGALSLELQDIGLRPTFSKTCQNYMSSACHACEVCCPVNAISIASNQLPSVNWELCSGCGQCKRSCHQNAIALRLEL